ncbi:hypothetical protein T459_03433 [Capsicum annuum]|uniref:Uncharacterized protein n=1 Tax=Capsicum annuum TaxID=4072 RepID=A0A2G3AMT7_CAPAN|nr:hypothetical protein T459_03433 [Capsicum annuum]
MVKDKLETEEQKKKAELEELKANVAAAEKKKVKGEKVSITTVKDEVKELKGKEVKMTIEEDLSVFHKFPNDSSGLDHENYSRGQSLKEVNILVLKEQNQSLLENYIGLWKLMIVSGA